MGGCSCFDGAPFWDLKGSHKETCHFEGNCTYFETNPDSYLKESAKKNLAEFED